MFSLKCTKLHIWHAGEKYKFMAIKTTVKWVIFMPEQVEIDPYCNNYNTTFYRFLQL